MSGSFSAEQTFRAAVATAEGVKQQAIAVAWTTYAVTGGMAPSGLATYITAKADAEVAFITAFNTAYNALNDTTGGLGLNSPIPGAGWTPLMRTA